MLVLLVALLIAVRLSEAHAIGVTPFTVLIMRYSMPRTTRSL